MSKLLGLLEELLICLAAVVAALLFLAFFLIFLVGTSWQ